MGIPAQPGYFFYGIACVLPGPEIRTRNIHGIGTAVYGRDADVCISCRSKQFEWSHLLLEGSNLLLGFGAELGVGRCLLVELDGLGLVAGLLMQGCYGEGDLADVGCAG